MFFNVVSCGSPKNRYTGSLTAVPAVLNFNGEDNRFPENRCMVTIAGNERNFRVSTAEEWIEVKEDGECLLIGVDQNDTGDARTGTVRVVSHMKRPVEITVNQESRNIKDYDFFTGSYSVTALIKWPCYDEPVSAEWISEITALDRSKNIYEIKNFGKEGFSLPARYENGFLIIDLDEDIDFADCVDCRIMGGVVHRDYYVVEDWKELIGKYDSDRDIVWFPSADSDVFIGILDVKNDRRRTELYSDIMMKRR